MGMRRGKNEGKTNYAICLTHSFIFLKIGKRKGKDIKVYKSLNLYGTLNHAMVSETLEHVYVLIIA